MGNCSQKSCSIRAGRVQVYSESGHLIEFEGPKLAGDVVGKFPGGYGIFRGSEMTWPLNKGEQLQNGQVYYALPLGKGNSNCRRRAKESFMSPQASNHVGTSLPSKRNGVWRVKLAISVEELEEIMAGQLNLDSFIHRMRMGQGLNVRN